MRFSEPQCLDRGGDHVKHNMKQQGVRREFAKLQTTFNFDFLHALFAEIFPRLYFDNKLAINFPE